ncbi:MAG: molybdopterin-guanine dinucleotide biosynthesis protein B [Methylotenera sp. 24-45-7]|jgi:molybdopterin-guanine dinucleotide biosynthesis protein MobB|nr:MAG: molybdopterin-guanine dinucleotide biosynthesis protein B [Mehylophilales bacterium 35-46-6]OYZ40845.1 MAG: molybdopterin-guanine dinucleotide biosynthesis protein B [Methylotenera sp. 24-45-7]OZA09546.1 MAG: molybdopterin-guanine dinucleotide biosynthesis protein B [Methylotenera sp. 17-45-7]OZA53970.1 MAG: molybdopterin-guanine dinucleotide biosynthesis protein B [Methylophilales bacterium 39-45-7]HQS37050.1 molybdopterin-guanine dinucleotide biosynthesis protein B [Methylotenera sp.]
MAKSLPILGICATGSNSGKTTLISKLIPELAKHKIRVSVIKHAHHKFDIDHPGKDSYEIREAGAVQTLIASGKRWALMTEMQRTPNPPDEANLQELIANLNPDYADLILVEGFKHADIPKIEVHRVSLAMPLLSAIDSSIIAIATDAPLANAPDIKQLDLNNIQQITDFILQTICQK